MTQSVCPSLASQLSARSILVPLTLFFQQAAHPADSGPRRHPFQSVHRDPTFPVSHTEAPPVLSQNRVVLAASFVTVEVSRAALLL